MPRRKKPEGDTAISRIRAATENTGREIALLLQRQTGTRRQRTTLAVAGLCLALGIAALAHLWPRARPEPEIEKSTEAAKTEAPAPQKRALRRKLEGPSADWSPSLGRGPQLRAQRADPVALARKIAEDKKGAVQLCFERVLKRNPKLKGKVLVALDLKPPNAVSAVQVRDTLHEPDFTRCVSGTMRRLFLPNLSESVSIEIPFVLVSPL